MLKKKKNDTRLKKKTTTKVEKGFYDKAYYKEIM